LTVVGDNPLGLQLETIYAGEIQALRELDRKLAEITCLAIEPTCEFHRLEVFCALTQVMIQLAYWRRFDDLLIAIHPRHEHFYQRYFLSDAIGPCRPHGFVSGRPAVGCRIDLHKLVYRASPELFRFYMLEVIEPQKLWPPIDPAAHRDFFCRRMGIRVDEVVDGLNIWHRKAA
jgi:hypothetical protein